jgi:cytochrome c oxidase subunit 2
MRWELTSALAPAGPQAARLAHVTWVFLGVCGAVYVVVLVLLAVALWRRGDPTFDERRRLTLVAAGGGFTAFVLVALLVESVAAGRGLNPMRGASEAFRVRVVARQWWWELQYPGSAPDQLVVSANELHIPVGQPVLLELVSRDVIHSLWVPSLHGKRDLVPGHDSTTWVQADRAGVFRGQCSEFCGAQHARMGLLVVAQPRRELEAWLSAQRGAGASVLSAEQARGRVLFLHGTCATCHAVAGTTAGATLGPDLTHVASRLALGAGTVPNTRAGLRAWIADPHAFKPGNRMPPTPLPPEDLGALSAYLEALR